MRARVDPDRFSETQIMRVWDEENFLHLSPLMEFLQRIGDPGGRCFLECHHDDLRW